MDPLRVIREAQKNKAKIHAVDGGNFVMGSKRLAGSEETCFKKSSKAMKGYYTVAEVVLFLEYGAGEGQVTEYYAKAKEQGLAFVARPDVESMKNYLFGDVDTCNQIDTLKQESQRRARAVDAAAAGSHDAMDVATESGPGEQASAERLEELRRIATDMRTIYEDQRTEETHKAFMEADKQYLAFMRQNVEPALTRTTVMERPNTDFGFALDVFRRVLRERDADIQKAGANGGASSSGTPATKRMRTSIGSTDPAPGFDRRSKGSPIMIVPNSMTCVISSLNIKDFLVDKAYVSIKDKKKGGTKRQASQTLRLPLKPGGTPQEVRVTDNPASIKDDEWDRVVAVFVAGQEWQFKPMRWKDPVELFKNVVGIHITQDDVDVSKTPVGKWRCSVIRINTSRRHLDAVAAGEAMKAIHNYMRIHRPWLIQG